MLISNFADRLKEALDIRKMSQADLVRKTGINKGAISSYLKGRYEPKQSNIYLIAKALDVDEGWIIGFDVPMERKPRGSEIDYTVKIENPEMDILIEKISHCTEDQIQKIREYAEYILSKR